LVFFAYFGFLFRFLWGSVFLHVFVSLFYLALLSFFWAFFVLSVAFGFVCSCFFVLSTLLSF